MINEKGPGVWGSVGGLVGVESLFDSFRKICHLLELKLFSFVLFIFCPFSEGTKYEDYSFTLVPDNVSRTNADLGAFGVLGPSGAPQGPGRVQGQQPGDP